MTKKFEDFTIKEIIQFCENNIETNPGGCIGCELRKPCSVFDGMPIYFYDNYGKYLKKEVTLSDTGGSAET